MNRANESPASRPKSLLDLAVAQLRAMYKQEKLNRRVTVRFIKPFAGITVPVQPFCCPECGCRQYRMLCGMRECSWCHGKGRLLGRAGGAP